VTQGDRSCRSSFAGRRWLMDRGAPMPSLSDISNSRIWCHGGGSLKELAKRSPSAGDLHLGDEARRPFQGVRTRDHRRD
jgi:hypothetical protein